MSEKEIQHWMDNANSPALSEYIVPWVTSEHPKAWQIGLKWIASKKRAHCCGRMEHARRRPLP